MYFRQFLDDRLGCASYLIASNSPAEAAVVDPGVDVAQYERVLAERKLRLRYVIDTHIHADHISGARRLAAATGADLCLYESVRANYSFRRLRDGEDLPLGELRLRVLHTPGHRPELIAIAVIDLARSEEPLLVLTGDSLLVGDAGRPDFNGGDPAAQFDSLQRLLGLPEWVAVFPGHFEGLCGAGMSGASSTTIGAERRFNPLARLDRADFVAELTSSIPPRPLNITAIEATNRGHADLPWAMLTSAAAVPELTVDALAAHASDSVIVDVREPTEYHEGHIPGAVNIPQADLATRLDELPRDRPLVAVCLSGQRSLRAAQFLTQAGFSNVATMPGGLSAWIDSGRPAAASTGARETILMAD